MVSRMASPESSYPIGSAMLMGFSWEIEPQVRRMKYDPGVTLAGMVQMYIARLLVETRGIMLRPLAMFSTGWWVESSRSRLIGSGIWHTSSHAIVPFEPLRQVNACLGSTRVSRKGRVSPQNTN
jgi:hypothetical protein